MAHGLLVHFVKQKVSFFACDPELDANIRKLFQVERSVHIHVEFRYRESQDLILQFIDLVLADEKIIWENSKYQNVISHHALRKHHFSENTTYN